MGNQESGRNQIFRYGPTTRLPPESRQDDKMMEQGEIKP